MGSGKRLLLVMLGITLLTALLRMPFRSAGMAGIGLLMPLFLAVPWLILGWYNSRSRERPQCPDCELPLSYRPLGPSHGMLECPALCGYRKVVGNPGGRP